MRNACITTEIKCDELANLIDTAGRAERITARMPAITLRRLRAITSPIVAREDVPKPIDLSAGSGTVSLAPRHHRIVLIATGAVVTTFAVLGLATVF